MRPLLLLLSLLRNSISDRPRRQQVARLATKLAINLTPRNSREASLVNELLGQTPSRRKVFGPVPAELFIRKARGHFSRPRGQDGARDDTESELQLPL